MWWCSAQASCSRSWVWCFTTRAPRRLPPACSCSAWPGLRPKRGKRQDGEQGAEQKRLPIGNSLVEDDEHSRAREHRRGRDLRRSWTRCLRAACEGKDGEGGHRAQQCGKRKIFAAGIEH